MQLGTDDNIKSTLGFIGDTGDRETNYLAAVIIQLLDRIRTLEDQVRFLKEGIV